MQKSITEKTDQSIARSSYSNWSRFIPKLDQSMIPAEAGPWILEEISDINSNIFHIYYPAFLSTPHHIRNGILAITLDPKILTEKYWIPSWSLWIKCRKFFNSAQSFLDTRIDALLQCSMVTAMQIFLLTNLLASYTTPTER